MIGARAAAVALVAAAIAAGAAPVVAAPVVATDGDAEVVEWRAAAARWPVAPGATAAEVAAAPARAGAVVVDAGREVVVWLAPLELVRLRAATGTLAAVRVAREPGAGAAARTARLTEPAPGAARSTLLVEPPGPGALWRIDATEPTEVVVERAVPRAPRLAWEQRRAALLAWIDRGGARPAIGARDGGAAALRLEAGARVARAVAGAPAAVRRAVRAWRRVEVEAEIARARPARDPYVAVTALDAGALARGGVRVRGPGAVVVDAWATPARDGELAIEVWRDGAAVARARGPATAPAIVRAPDAALAAAPPPGGAGRRVRVVVAVPPGEHALRVVVPAATAVEAELWSRRRRLRDLWDPVVAAAPLADALAGVDVTAELATLAAVAAPGPALAADAVAAHLDALERAARGGGDPIVVAAAALALAARLPDGAPGEALARRALDVARAVEAPAAVLAALAPRLAPDDALAAADHAWRAAPGAPALRAAYLAAWRRTAWRRVAPAPDAGLSPAPAPARWIAATAGAGGGGWLPVTAAAPVALDVPAAADPARLAVLRVALSPGDGAPAPVALDVDGAIHHVLPVGAVDRVELAVAPGPHRVSVAGPPGLRAWVSAPGIAAGGAVVRTLWPVDEAVRYPVEGARAVRIELRVAARATSPRAVWLHSDVAAPRRLVLAAAAPTSEAGADADELRPFDDAAGAALGAGVAVIAWTPPGARRLWLTPDDESDDEEPLWAHVAVRAAAPSGPAGASAPDAGAPDADAAAASRPDAAGASAVDGLDPAAALARVRELSAALARAPDAGALVARAAALVALGELREARRDLSAARALLAAAPDAAVARAADAVDVALDRDAAPGYLPPQPASSPVVSGSILAPALAALAPTEDELAALAPAVARLRADGAAAAVAAIPGRGAAAQALRARLARLAGDPAAAAAALADVAAWPARVEALAALAAVVEAGDAAAAPHGYAVATALADVELPAVRRARAVVARASRWQRVRATEASAGHESLVVAPGALDEAPGDELRAALLAAPWPRAVHQRLAPGDTATLAVDGPRSVRVEVWCRRLRPSPGPARCALDVRVDHAPARAVTAAHGDAVAVATVEVPAGAHQLEVTLGGDDPAAVAAVRFVDGAGAGAGVDEEKGGGDAGAIAVTRPARAFLARPDRPVELIVAGPGAVAVELRRAGAAAEVGAAGGVTATLELLDPDGAVIVATPVALAAGLAPEARAAGGRAVAFGPATEQVVALVAAGPHRVRIRSRGGAVAVRAAVRVPGAPPESPEPPEPGDVEARSLALVGVDSAGGAAAAWPAVAAAPRLDAVEPVALAFATPSIEAVVGHDDLEALDADLAPLGLRLELAAQLRRRAGGAWLRGELRGRRLGALAPTAIARVVAEWRGLPAAVDATAAVTVAAQDARWSALATARVERPLALGPALELVPGVAAVAARADAAARDADPLVASDHRHDHPRQLGARLGARWRPFADQLAIARVEAWSNADLVTVDRLGLDLAWHGLVELGPARGPLVALRYRPGVRFADGDRAARQLRHDLGAAIAWSAAVPGGRVTVSVHGDVFVAPGDGVARAARVELRWDLGRGGPRDRSPAEQPLRDFAEERAWTAR